MTDYEATKNNIAHKLDMGLPIENWQAQALVDEIAKLRAELDKHRWIPLRANPPKIDEPVLWCHKSFSSAKEGWLDSSGRIHVWGGIFYDAEKYYFSWMPLPEPPEVL